MQSNKTRPLLTILLVLAAGEVPVFAQSTLDGNALRTMAESLPLEVGISGRFLFSPVFFPEIGSDVFVCEIDHAQSGGRFCFATTNDSVQVLVDTAGDFVDIFQVLKDEWYLVSNSDGASALASIPFRRWRDGTDEAGLNVVSDISIYRFEGGMTSIATSSSLPRLVCAPEFSLLERPDWHLARRSGTNEWVSTILSNKVDCKSRFEGDPLFGDPIIRDESQKTGIEMAARLRKPSDGEADLSSALSNQFSTISPATARVVSETGGTEDQPFVLVSAGDDETEEGCLWSAYLWDGEQWTQPSPEGFKFSSGRCPTSFRAHADDFYRLTLDGEPPRLVVLQNRDGNLRELFWETALDSKIEFLNCQNGLPSKGYQEAFGLPATPRSFLQSLEAGSPFRRLERVHPRPLLP